ncbi:hypothetical protein ETH_00037435 [Eimeria tenella]|uniref:Uncharacterized protein n=1 Tax=Eimeria tenella TaxID=5802 RepID=U6KUL5_EIMTE|nr:hypothetical protein ETH_00037435 [Eimeria tenella]CDJ39195.1 hypothetical protein ETH_00037435 [Eimeria tenella]|eukprot:XP_013229950.1 hypothetical protein ETH_00037435 [Eimeria tenella]
MSLQEKMNLQAEAAADARELLEIYLKSNKMKNKYLFNHNNTTKPAGCSSSAAGAPQVPREGLEEPHGGPGGPPEGLEGSQGPSGGPPEGLAGPQRGPWGPQEGLREPQGAPQGPQDSFKEGLGGPPGPPLESVEQHHQTKTKKGTGEECGASGAPNFEGPLETPRPEQARGTPGAPNYGGAPGAPNYAPGAPDYGGGPEGPPPCGGSGGPPEWAKRVNGAPEEEVVEETKRLLEALKALMPQEKTDWIVAI